VQIVGRHAVQPPAMRSSILAIIASTGADAKIDVVGAVHLDVDEAGREQRVAEIDRVGGRRSATGGDDATVGRHQPRRRCRRAPFTVENPCRDERGHPWRSLDNAKRSFTKPSSVRGTRFMIDVRAGAAR